MKIHRHNHTRKPDRYTERWQVLHENAERFQVFLIEGGKVKISVRCFEFDWEIELLPEEAKKILEVLNSN